MLAQRLLWLRAIVLVMTRVLNMTRVLRFIFLVSYKIQVVLGCGLVKDVSMYDMIRDERHQMRYGMP